MRLYVPGDWSVLRGSVPDGGRFRGHVVTDALREALPGLDEEQLEDYVQTEAAQDSLRRLRDEADPRRRLVLVFEADAVEPVADSVTGAVADGLAVPQDVVAWLVDTEDAAGTVGDAVAALRSEPGDEWSGATRRAVEACLDHPLAWYSATETGVVAELG